MKYTIGNKYTKYIFMALLLFWMGVIFMMSCENADDSTQTSGFIVDSLAKLLGIEFFSDGYWTLTTVVRKLAHLTEFAILGALAFINVCHFKLSKRVRLVTSFAFCVLYATSDEIHQYFVPGRACRFTDVCIDSFGCLLGIVFIFLIINIYFKRRKNNETSDLR